MRGILRHAGLGDPLRATLGIGHWMPANASTP